MHITADDICGMASPGWGSGLDFEVPDLLDEGLDVEVKDDQDSEDDYAEIGLKKAVPEEKPEPEPGKKRFRYGEDGRREGLSTLEICNYYKNRMLRKDRLEREFLAINKIYPKNGADRKILIWLAAGRSYQETAELVGRTVRTVKNAVQRLRQFRDTGKVKLLPAGQVQTVEALMEPFKKSRAGRKPKKITTAAIIQLDLCGDPIQLVQARARKARRQAGVRRMRVRQVCEGQLSLFDMAA
jgi:DNA-binding CsgD family transcriptional regulator